MENKQIQLNQNNNPSYFLNHRSDEHILPRIIMNRSMISNFNKDDDIPITIRKSE